MGIGGPMPGRLNHLESPANRWSPCQHHPDRHLGQHNRRIATVSHTFTTKIFSIVAQ